MSDDALRVLRSIKKPPPGVIERIDGAKLEHTVLCPECARGAYEAVIEALIGHFERTGWVSQD